MPRVSVLLTCYNHLAYLPIALDSILAQSFGSLEVIALDDGSTDGTREWLASLNDPRVRVVLNEQNLGTYGTLNRGLSEAQGELMAVLNDDDVWAPAKLERQVALLDQNPRVGLVHTNGRFIDGSGAVFTGEPLGFAFPKMETGDGLETLLYANKIIASAVLARRACFEQVGQFDSSYFGSGDWEMWLRIAEHWDIGFVDERLTDYRVHGANASHKLERIWRDDLALRTWIESRVPEWAAAGRLSSSALKAAQSHNLACIGTVQTLLGSAGEGRRAFAASLRVNPRRWQSGLRWMQTFLPRSWVVGAALKRASRVHRDQLAQ